MLAAGDPLRGEWDIAVLGPHFAATLVARDLGDTGPDAQRRFEFVLSHDRELTIAVAHSLMSRIWPEPKTVDLPDLPGPAPIRLPAQRPDQHTRTRTPAGASASSACPVRAAPAALTPPPVLSPPSVPAIPPELLQRAVAAATTGMTITDVREPDQPLVWVNPAFTQLTGYPSDQLLGRNCRLLQGPGTEPAVVAEIGAAITAGTELRARLLNYRADGTPWWNELHLCPVHDEAGLLTHYIGVQNDITARIEAEQTVLHLAYHDPLTRLPNRTRLADVLTRALDRAQHTGNALALLSIDLDNFKQVNDTHGHSAGDLLLRDVATRLRTAARADDLLARQGGDEFLLLLTDLPPHQAARIAGRTAQQLGAALRQPFMLQQTKLTVTASIGVAVDTAGVNTADDLLRIADAAMYRVKNSDNQQPGT